jgi:DNA repair protein SbcC/Rad50
VLFNQERGGIDVQRKDGQILEAEKLSGGAYDQLYLAIRLALGERILQGTKGFFVMDDPFVKADPARLQKQIEVLKRISQSGWQIIYFTAKGEMREMVKPLIKRGAVTCVEIQGIFS